ncbi:MAG: DUF2851 family protein [Bacteroidales bacterium]|nr:DUF2851 family protein [Bacteroidales bacterium]MCM1146883.1 DUF2851 family protein [Bacteroidales bacterium]MCM1205619.1 DUF2851 family protein [Bacillota bacterium]MCM1510270.1 DUF2851 family protein [Clostridium sp.]
MEKLLHYCWKHGILPSGALITTDGRDVEVIDPGLHNTDSGPDFFNARVSIGGELWAGNVELHIASKDWFAHRHDKDSAYDNVILHVVSRTSGAVKAVTSGGREIPEIIINVPAHVRDNYGELLCTDSYPPCYRNIPHLTSLKVHSWMASLQTERLMQKTAAVEEYLRQLSGDWEHAYFVALARSFGFGSNADALEQWARTLPLKSIAHHRDDLFQVEAFFLGHAGLIRDNLRMQQEYDYLCRKFSVTAAMYDIMPSGGQRCAPPWKFMRMRPQNFPDVRIRQLARLFHEGRTSLSQLLDCEDTESLGRLIGQGLSQSSVGLLMINCAIPMLFAYGRVFVKEELCERALDLLESLPPENNAVTRMWRDVGLDVRSAGDSQALIQLKKQYCDRRDCLCCRFGYEYLNKTVE